LSKPSNGRSVPLVAAHALRQLGNMSGHVAAIFRHPIKGFTPEALTHVDLTPGEGVPHDRIFAVENGPSGFDPAAPAFIPKQKFTVLMSIPQVAAARTRYDDATGTLSATAPDQPAFVGGLGDESGRAAFAAWMTGLLGDEARGPLRVIEAPTVYRFTDHPQGQVSIINLASVRDLSQRVGAELDPLRFRANLYVEGWPAWAENGWTGQKLMLGWGAAEVFKPIVRCAAVNVHPDTALRDQDLTKALFDNFGHMHCGIYVRMTAPGRVSLGDAVSTPAVAPASEDAEWA
jgi:uncharacterized protein YcbX